MEEELAPSEFEKIKEQFRGIGCTVADFSETHFEVVSQQFPAACLVYANPYFLEINTLLWARPKNPWPRFRSKRDSLLNEANQIANLAKLTCDAISFPREEGGWRLQATARIVTGRVGSEYATESVEHWLTLFLQDIANVILLDHGFELVAMMKDEEESEQ
jgi:hypothetical protein